MAVHYSWTEVEPTQQPSSLRGSSLGFLFVAVDDCGYTSQQESCHANHEAIVRASEEPAA